MIRVERKKAWKAPKIKGDKELLEQFGKIGVSSILWNIKHQTNGDGSPIQSNSVAWTKRKQDLGLSQAERSLIAIGRRLIKRSSYITTLDEKKVEARISLSDVVITARKRGVESKGSPKQIAGWVDEMGYTTQGKRDSRDGWMDINDKARSSIRAAVREYLRRLVSALRG